MSEVRLPVATWTLDTEDLCRGQVLPDVAYLSVVDVGHRRQPYVIVLRQRNFRERTGAPRRDLPVDPVALPFLREILSPQYAGTASS